MRIAFYAPLKPPTHKVPSGDRAMARLLMRALSMAGHEVRLASELRAWIAAEDGAGQARLRTDGAAEAARLAALWRADPDLRPDLFFTYHLYYRSPDFLGPTLKEALGIPYAVAEASFAMKRAEGAFALGHAATAHALGRADIVFCLSARDRPGLARVPGFAARIVDLPPFIDPGPDPARRERAGGPVLLAVAMMRARAKLESYRLLAAALAGLVGRPWRLEIAGDGPGRAEVEALFAPFGARVAFLGALDESALRQAYARADVFAWPGFGEAYGMVYLEAQAAGLPVVAMDLGGVANVVVDGVSGRLVTAGDGPAYATALAELLADPVRRRTLGASASAFVRAERSLSGAAALLERELAPFAAAA